MGSQEKYTVSVPFEILFLFRTFTTPANRPDTGSKYLKSGDNRHIFLKLIAPYERRPYKEYTVKKI